MHNKRPNKLTAAAPSSTKITTITIDREVQSVFVSMTKWTGLGERLFPLDGSARSKRKWAAVAVSQQ